MLLLGITQGCWAYAGLGTDGLMLRDIPPGLCRAPDIAAGIHAELAKHHALAVAGPAVVKFSHIQSMIYVAVSASVKSPKE